MLNVILVGVEHIENIARAGCKDCPWQNVPGISFTARKSGEDPFLPPECDSLTKAKCQKDVDEYLSSQKTEGNNVQTISTKEGIV